MSEVEVNRKWPTFFNQKHPEFPNISQGTMSKIHSQPRKVGHVKRLRRKPHFIQDTSFHDEKLYHFKMTFTHELNTIEIVDCNFVKK